MRPAHHIAHRRVEWPAWREFGAGRRHGLGGGASAALWISAGSAVLDEPFIDLVEDIVRILVVEDEPRLAELIRRGLVAEGFVVQVAGDGRVGFDEAVGGGFDVLVLDIMLPSMSGYEIVRDLRKADVWTPVLMLSAKDGEYDLADAFDLGADDYLIKPFSFVVLIARLRALLRRGAPARPPVLRVDDLELDPARHQVNRAGVEVELTPREYGVLEYLMRHADTVVTKQEVLQSVWDINYEGDDNIVEVYVGYLRRKLDVPFGTQTIHTVRGVGYRMSSAGA
ncbi:Transcriptional regulatory protein TcrA (modular protein) [uncultured Mycobacterium sp.]|uniref:Transcriptional regulatory protein TcrA (Modular protein) n=1 Tax=uncultured Mycobacterium sp. TaxID=171292 RepID=A0A1Y5PLF4_9MYCO|nr:Transcriptional regulatory protein TcrA (modular protein) [uncultured Mycobacterium sp.]